MLRSLFFFVLITCFSISVVAQLESLPQNHNTHIKYYKKFLYKPCSEKSAVFKAETTVEKGVRKEVVTHLKTGQIRMVKSWKGSTPIGIWKTYDEKGNVIQETDFSQILIESCPVELEDSVGYVAPKYPGEESAMYSFLGRSMRYPAEARDNNIQGRIYLCVFIDKEGNLTVNSAIKEASPYLIMEGKRVLELMDKWEPATRDGIPVGAYMVFPLVFKLQ